MAKRNILIENERTVTKENLLFEQVKQLLDDARTRIARTVNTTIVNVYWQIGKYIVEYEQGGQGRAAFGKDIINKLSERLTKNTEKDSRQPTFGICGSFISASHFVTH